MRRQFPILLSMLMVGLAGSASAQGVIKPFAATPAGAPSGPQATPEDVVARLMWFDRNYDGQIARAELPERLHDMLTRGDKDKNQTLDATEVRQLAAKPVSRQASARGLETGQYGFGDSFGLDSRLHIEGAIDDLRLAQNDRDEAVAIARRFQDARDQQAKSELLNTMGQMLTGGALEDFKANLERQPRTALRVSPAVSSVMIMAAEAALQRVEGTMIRLRTMQNAARLIDRYGLQPAEQEKARAAIDRYNTRTTGHLMDEDRVALLDRLETVLADDQLDDLRAALERRPIVKQSGFRFVANGQQISFPTPPDVATIQDLLLRQ